MNIFLLYTRKRGGAEPCDASMRQSVLAYVWLKGVGDFSLVSM